jgi:hypothetical protein
VLNQTDDVVTSDMENFLVTEIWVLLKDDIADSIVLSHENSLENSQSDVFVDSEIASDESSSLISWQKISF